MPSPSLPQQAPLSTLEALREAFRSCRRSQTDRPNAWFLLDPAGDGSAPLQATFERYVRRAGGIFIAGSCRNGFDRPFDGLLDLAANLAERVAEEATPLLPHYESTFVNLLPSWRQRGNGRLARTRELRSGLTDFALRGDPSGLKDFYWRRDARPTVTADLVGFILDGTAVLQEIHGAPVVLWLEDLHAAAGTREAVELLAGYLAARPVLLCATGRETVAAKPSWCHRTVSPPADDSEELLFGPAVPREPDLAAAYRAACVLALPFRAEDWLALLPAPQPDSVGRFHELVERGLLRSVGSGRFSVAQPSLGRTALASASDSERRELHARALGVEALDPFAAAWHARQAGLPDATAGPLFLAALERAWAVSDCDTALSFAERLPSQARPDVDREIVLALLHYEAGRFRQAERFLSRVTERHHAAGTPLALLFDRLLGYNAVFGLNDFRRGLEILESVQARYEQEGLLQDAGFIRNSIAFALARSGRVGEALAVETSTLALAEELGNPAAGLASILQLNLGRLYRNRGNSEQALELFQQAMEDRELELSPYMLLIFHISLAHLHTSRQDHAATVRSWHHCLELSRDLKLESTSDTVLTLLSSPLGRPLPPGVLTRADEVSFYLHLSLAVACRQAGLTERAAACMAGMQWIWSFLAPEIWQAAEGVAARVQPSPAPGPGLSLDADDPLSVLGRFAGLLTAVPSSAGTAIAQAVEALARQLAVGVVWSRDVGGVQVVDSLVLYDPRNPDLVRRVQAELGAYPTPRARALLLLPEAADFFESGTSQLPVIQQQALLRPRRWDEYRGVSPARSRVQILSPHHDGPLFELLLQFQQRTGAGALAALPFHLRRRDLAVTPEKAALAFLLSSVDRLVLGDRMILKRNGAAADENLLPFRPRLSSLASVLRDPGQTDGVTVRLRIWSHQKYLRLRGETGPFLDLCDGEKSLSQVLGALENPLRTSPEWKAQACRFARDLWHQGVLCFDGPA